MNSGSGKTIAAFCESPGVGGAKRILLEYLSYLKKRGWSVRLLFGGVLPAEAERKLRVWAPDLDFRSVTWRTREEYVIPIGLQILDRRNIKGLKAAFEECKPDLVLLNQPGPDNLQGAIEAAYRIRPRIPVVALVHQAPVGLIPIRLLGLKKLLARYAYRNIDRFLTVSNATAASLQEHYKVPRDKLVVLHNGVRDLMRRCDGERLASVRASLGIVPGDVFGLWIGRLTYEKGVDVLLSALRLTEKTTPNFKMRIVGTGELLGDLKMRFSDLVERGTVAFLGWRDDADELLNACDLVVVPSRLEGFGLLIAEAMSAAKPVVASRVYATPEVVADGETGVLVPPDAPAELAAAIERLSEDEQLRIEMGNAGRKRYEERFTLTKAAKRFEKALENILTQP